MRTIQISTDVFQAIWATRQPGEEDEDAVLRRLLAVTVGDAPLGGAIGQSWMDRYYSITFPHGFEMHRRLKGVEFIAVVINGKWELNGRRISATSIAEVSKAAGAGPENGWTSWRYRASSGEERKISELRDPNLIIRRSPNKNAH